MCSHIQAALFVVFELLLNLLVLIVLNSQC